MSYIRVKWIKGHPYLYEQESYREGKKVKTRFIRYIGKAPPGTTGGKGTPVQRQELSDEWYDVTLYRGGSSDYDTFDMTKAGTGDGVGFFGNGFYLTDSKDVADHYALESGKRQHIEKYIEGSFGAVIPVYKPDAEVMAEQTKVITVFRVTGKLLDANNYKIDSECKQMLIDIYAEHVDNRVYAEERIEYAIAYFHNNIDKIHHNRGEFCYVLGQTISIEQKPMAKLQAYFKQKGYDGIKFRGDETVEGGIGTDYLIFDPSKVQKVKSVRPPRRKENQSAF